MSRITLEAPDAPEVELFGHVYTIVPITKAAVAKADAAEAKVDDAEDSDQLVAAYGALLDVRLRPTAEKQPRASTVLVKAWNGNDVSLKQINQLVIDVASTDRPTFRSLST